MATLICNGTGNLTGSTTFAAAEIGALALNLIRFSITTTVAAAASVTSATFTVTNAKVIDGVILWVKQSAAGSTGTFKVDLQKGGVSQATVTVNKTDLPADTNAFFGPTLFKLTSTATGDGGANWTIVITTTGTQTVTYAITASGATNLTRALRTTTAATPAAGDDLYVTGELTGAGTHTSYTVTMDSTATTVYGNGTVDSTTVSGGLIAVANYGTLSYGTTGAINYYLKLAGDVKVYQFGTFNIGSSGSEIPRNSTAVLEFQMASAAVDFGLYVYDNATFNSAGLSRTSAKNVVKCKLTSNVAGASTITSTATTALTSNIFTRDLDATGTSYIAGSVQENAANSTHGVVFSGPAVTAVTQTVTVWLARGTGASNNRFVRVTVGNNTVQTSVTNGFFSDIDLQSGTAGTVTAVGNGTATSVSITVAGTGYLVKMTGVVSSALATPSLLLNACSASTTTSYAAASNWNFVYDHVALVTASSISDTTLNVDTDTGWLSGDAVCVAGTTRTITECELFSLNANAGASSLVSSLYPVGLQNTSPPLALTHSGTSPTAAEVGLIARNVKIRTSSAAALATFVYGAALASMTMSWTEFSVLGSSTAKKRGLEFDTSTSGTATAKSVTFCSVRDGVANGSLYISAAGSVSANVTWSNNVIWNSANGATVAVALTNTDWTMDSNLWIKIAGVGLTLSDVGGTITNNTWANGSFSNIWSVSETAGTLGTWDNNTIHSGNAGLAVGPVLGGTISNLTIWRMGSAAGGVTTTQLSDVYFTNLNIFGCNSIGLAVTSGDVNVNVGSISGDTSFATATGVVFNSGLAGRFNLNNVDFSGTGTGLAAITTADLATSGALISFIVQANNCKVGGATFTKTNWSDQSYAAYEKYNQTAADHRCEMKYGGVKTDSVIYRSATPSLRMTPSNATFKMASAPRARGILAAVASGTTVTVNVYVRKSVVGDGTAYNGNQPRLIQRVNYALGQTADVVLATAAGAAGSWELLSGTTSAITDDGAWELIIDCDGTTGWVNVDDWNFT